MPLVVGRSDIPRDWWDGQDPESYVGISTESRMTAEQRPGLTRPHFIPAPILSSYKIITSWHGDITASMVLISLCDIAKFFFDPNRSKEWCSFWGWGRLVGSYSPSSTVKMRRCIKMNVLLQSLTKHPIIHCWCRQKHWKCISSCWYCPQKCWGERGGDTSRGWEGAQRTTVKYPISDNEKRWGFHCLCRWEHHLCHRYKWVKP